MANSNGWGDGAANNAIGWGQGANNAIAWGDSHAKSWAGATDIVGLTTDPAASAYFAATGITGATQQAAIDNLVKGLKADGIWSKMKAVYPFVTDNRNLLSYTEDFNNAAWFKVDNTITANNTIAPNGTLTADKVTNTNAGSGDLYQFFNLGANTYTFTIYAKYIDSQWLRPLMNNGTNGVAVWFDILNGVVGSHTTNGTSTLISKSIENVGNGWYRLQFTGYLVGTTGNYYQINNAASNGSNTRILGSFFTWGAQLELGSTATTYQPIATTQQAFIASQFKYNLVNPVDSDAAFRLVFNGGWTHSSNGATPNGTNGYADTKFIANTNLTKGDGHLSYYSRTNSADSSSSTTMGDNTGGRGRIVLRRTTDIAYMECGTNGADSRTYTVTDSRCYAVANVISNQNVDFFRNGIKQTATAINSSNQGWSTGVIGIGGSVANGQYDNKQCAFSTIGNGLTDTEAANLYTRVQAYQTALSRNV